LNPPPLDPLDVEASRSDALSPSFTASIAMEGGADSKVGVVRSVVALVYLLEERKESGGAGTGRVENGIDWVSKDVDEGVGRR